MVISFGLGIFVQSFYVIDKISILWFLSIALALALVWRRRTVSSDRINLASNLVLLFVVFVFCFALGAVRMLWAEQYFINTEAESKFEEEIQITGVVVREPDVRSNSTQLFVRIDNGELFLVRTDRYSGINYGDELMISGTLSKAEAFETDLGRTFNYPDYLRAKGVSHIISWAEIEVVDVNQGNFLLHFILTQKQDFMHRLEEVIIEPEVGLAEGLLLGVKQGLGDNLEMAFRKTGIIHIVVLSGYNVMLVVTFVLYVFAYFLPFRARLIAGVIAIALFALLVGLSSTVVRASVMASLLLMARSIGKSYQVLRGLVVAGIIMLIINPYLLAFDIGFQLSFIATLGLILVAPYVESKFKAVPTSFGIREFLTATISTQIFVLPILLYQIGEFSVVAVLVNVLVLPMVPVAMMLTFLVGVTGVFSATIASVFGFLAYLSLLYIITLAEGFASLPFSALVVPAFPFWVVIGGYILIAIVLYIKFKTNQKIEAYDLIESFVKSKSAESTDDNGRESVVSWFVEEESIVKTRLSR
ncbi:ComEC/Rec2 family competence protein [Candidatus Kaiserbacteria bacterium]|nr:ComEC/Rec2 family competence protein [Candidatus Kaiserbacteria bacterium]